MACHCVTLEARWLVLQVRRPSSVAQLPESALIAAHLWATDGCATDGCATDSWAIGGGQQMAG
jgi:hypothetical protein